MNNTTKPLLAIFDLGNVVFRIDWDLMAEAWSKFSAIEAEVLKERFTYGQHFDAFERGDISGAEFANIVNTSLGMNLSYEQFKTGWNAIYQEVVLEVQNNLEQLQGKIRIIAYTNTNAIHNEVWPVLYKEVLKNFEKVFVSSDMGHRKPDAEGYRYVLDNCGVKAPEAIFFDDREENVEGARGVGIAAHLVYSNSVVSNVFTDLGFLT